MWQYICAKHWTMNWTVLTTQSFHSSAICNEYQLLCRQNNSTDGWINLAIDHWVDVMITNNIWLVSGPVGDTLSLYVWFAWWTWLIALDTSELIWTARNTTSACALSRHCVQCIGFVMLGMRQQVVALYAWQMLHFSLENDIISMRCCCCCWTVGPCIQPNVAIALWSLAIAMICLSSVCLFVYDTSVLWQNDWSQDHVVFT